MAGESVAILGKRMLLADWLAAAQPGDPRPRIHTATEGRRPKAAFARAP